MTNSLWLLNQTLFLTDLFVFTYKFLIKILNSWFPPYIDPGFFSKKLYSPEPYEIPLYLLLSFIFVSAIYIFQYKLNRQFHTLRKAAEKYGRIIFPTLLVVFLINIGSYPLKDDVRLFIYSDSTVKTIRLFFLYIITVFSIIFLVSRLRKKTVPVLFLLIFSIALLTLEPGFPSSPLDTSYFIGPISEIARGKTIFSSVSSQYGFLSILFLGILNGFKIFNPFYLPLFTWILYILQYFICFWIIYKASRSLIFGTLGLFSIITVNYFSLFHLPNSYPQIGPIRWLPLILSVFLLQLFKNFTNSKLILLFSLLTLWNIEAGIALFLSYGFSLFLLLLGREINIKKLIESLIFYIFNLIVFFFLLNLIYLVSGRQMINFIPPFMRLREFAVAGIAMLPIPWRTHFWFVLLVYFASVIYFFRQGNVELGDEKGRASASAQRFFQPAAGREHLREVISSQNLNLLLLFSANLSLFASVYFVGRSHPHNLFHISIFFLINLFLFLNAVFRKKLNLIFYLLTFLLLIVYPAFNRRQALSAIIKFKLDGLKKGQIFKPRLESKIRNYYFFETELIKKYLPEEKILILSVDDTFLFYLAQKKNLLSDNPQSWLASAAKQDLDYALKDVVKICPQKIIVSCTLLGICPAYESFNVEDLDIQKIMLGTIEKKCEIKYKPFKCTNKLCVITSN